MKKSLLLVMAAAIYAGSSYTASADPTYTAPSGTEEDTSGHNAKAYLANVTTTGAYTNLNITHTQKNATSIAYEHCTEQTLEVTPGSEFTLNLVANNASTTTTSAPPVQDLRYCVAYIFEDFNGDGVFTFVDRWGVFNSNDANYTNNSGVTFTWGGNFKANYDNVLNITQHMTVPADAPLGNCRIRVIYTEAWDTNARGLADTHKIIDGNYQSILKGYSYDFDVRVVEATPRTVTVASNNYAWGSVAIDGVTGNTVTTADAVSIVATPNAGYNFIGWFNGTTKVSDNASYTYTGARDADFVAEFTDLPEYCTPTYGGTGTSRTTTSRTDKYITTLTATDGVTSITINGASNSGRAVYLGSATQILPTQPGSTINITLTGSMWSMHSFAYLDADKNGLSQSDLVYNDTSANWNALSFTLPSDLAPGKYLVRYKLDWASNDPCKFADGESTDNGEAVIDFFIEIENNAVERTVTVASQDETMGTVSIEGITEATITTAERVVISATPAEGYVFAGWYNGADLVSNDNPYTYTDADDADFVAHFAEKTYPVMKRYFTGGTSDDNRYLGKVTTDALTETLFEFTSNDQIPYVAYTTVSTGENATRTTENACIDMTSYRIKVVKGTTDVNMTLYGYNSVLNGHNPYLMWTQETHYVDWNGNKEFTDEGERSEKNTLYGGSNPINTDGLPVVINIPADQPVGEYRMRVVFFGPTDNGNQNTAKSANWDTELFTSLNCEIRDGISYDFTIEIVEPGVKVQYLAQGNGSVKLSTDATDLALKPGSSTKIIKAIPAGEILENADDAFLYVPAGSSVHVFATPAEGNKVSFIVGDGHNFSLKVGGSGDDIDMEPHFVDTNNDGVQDATYFSFVVPADTDSESTVTVSATFEESALDIDTLINDLNAGATHIYDLRGVKVDAANVVRGNVYIVRTGTTIQKILVK